VIDHPQAPPTEAEIAALEGEIGAELPTDFKDFLKVANGGHLEYEVEVDHPGGRERLVFGGLFSTQRSPSAQSDWETFLGELKAAREAFRLPHQVLPIARDGGGSMLFLDLSEAGQGRVVAFVHGLPAWTGLRQTNAFVDVAPSFSGYVDKLYIPEDLAREAVDAAKNQSNQERLKAIRDWLEVGMPDWRSRLGSDIFGDE